MKQEQLVEIAKGMGAFAGSFDDGSMYIAFSNCALSKADLRFLGESTIPFLTTLSFFKVGMSDDVLSTLKPQTQLQSLSISESRVTGKGLRALNFPELRELRLDHCRDLEMLDTCSFIQRVSRISVLWLNDTQVNDDWMSVIGGLTHLIKLYVQGSAVSDAGLESLTQLKQLMHLNVDRTRVSREGFLRLKKRLPKLVDPVVY